MKRLQLLLTRLLPYALIFAAVVCLMYFGSTKTDEPVKTPIAANFDNSDFTVTADQVSESYTVANIASTLSLPSTSTISENYVTISDVYETTGTTSTSTSTVVEKPTIIDTSSLTRGIETYVIQEGDTFDSVYAAHNHGASRDQIRWSNSLKKETVTVGTTMYFPTVAGIVYKVKSNETLDSIIEKTGASSKEAVIQLNDLEDKEIVVDQLLLLQMALCQRKSAQNMSRQRRAQLILRLIAMSVTPPIVMAASKSIIIAIGAICITVLRGSITLAPSVTVHGSSGIGAVIISALNTGCQLAQLAMRVAGFRHSVVLIGLVVRQLMVPLCSPRADAMVTSP